MRFLIVNGDDFGASHGINRGIMLAHRRGILTSASLMVNTAWSREAAELSLTEHSLSVGLHADVDRIVAEGCGTGALRAALSGQIARFREMTGRAPTHLDSHHNAHRDPRALPCFLEAAEEHGLTLREHSAVRPFSKFYGQWDGRTHLGQISARSLARMLRTEIEAGVTELTCHPGYADADFPSRYGTEREVELQSLCDPLARLALEGRSIRLVGYGDLKRALRELQSERDRC